MALVEDDTPIRMKLAPHRWTSLSAFVLVLLVAPFARGQVVLSESGPPPKYPPVEIIAGGHVGTTWGDRCRRDATDVVSCTGAGALLGVHLGPLYRLASSWSLGLRGAASFGGHSTTWWQASAHARWHALGASSTDPWIGADAGIAAASESLAADELGPETTVTHLAPAFGLGVGIDLRMIHFLALGPEVFAVFIPFGTRPSAMPERGTSYASQLGVGLGITATVFIGKEQ